MEKEPLYLRVLFKCLACGHIYDDGAEGEQGAGYDLNIRNAPRVCKGCMTKLKTR